MRNLQNRQKYVQLLETICKEARLVFETRHGGLSSPYISAAERIPDDELAEKLQQVKTQVKAIDLVMDHAGLTIPGLWAPLQKRITELKKQTRPASQVPADPDVDLRARLRLAAQAGLAQPAQPVIGAVTANLDHAYLMFPSPQTLTQFVDALLSRDGITTLPAAQLRRDLRIWLHTGAAGARFGVSLPLERGAAKKALEAVGEISKEEITRHAHRIWERRGRPAGQDMQFWLEAEAELKASRGGAGAASGELLELVKLCQGEKRAAFPAGGEQMPLNNYLERVRLYSTGALPTRLECLILMNPAGANDALASAFQDFPAGQYSQCRFFMGQKDDKDNPLTLLIFEQVRSIARVAQWVRQLPPGMTVFCPVDGGARDVLFCPWQYTHPVAALSRLYDCADARYILMRPRGGAGEPRPWLRISRQAADEAVKALDQLFRIEIDPEKYVAPVVVDPLRSTPVISLPLRVSRAAGGGIVNTGGLQRRAESLRRELSELETRHDRAQQLIHGQSRVALVFHQEADDRIAPRLRRFLQRPYQTLDSYSYFFLRGGRGRQHVLFSNASTPLTDHLVSCADEMYVQDVRWPAWGLKAYLRHGIDLSPRLDDQAMAELVRKHLMPAEEEEPDACCLIDTITSEDGICNLSIVAIRKGQLLPLPQAIRLLNEQLEAGVASGVAELPKRARASIEARKLDLDGQPSAAANGQPVQGGAAPQGLAQFYEEMTVDLRLCTDEAVARWKVLDVRIQKVVDQLDASEPRVEEIETLLKAPAQAWEAFVDRVLGIQLKLCADKKGCFEALAQTEEAAKKNFEDATVTNKNAQERIAAADVQIEALINSLAPIETKTEADLQALSARLDLLHSKVAQMQRRLDPVTKTVNERALKIQRESEKLNEQLSRVQQALDKCSTDHADNEALRNDLVAKDTQVNSQTRHNREVLEGLKKMQEALEKRNKDLGVVQRQAEEKKKHVENLANVGGTDEFSQAVREWVASFKRRPSGWFGRGSAKRSAARAFGKVFDSAPSGFFDDDGVAVAPVSAPVS